MRKIQLTSKILGAILLAYLCMHLYVHTATIYSHFYELKPFELGQYASGTITGTLSYSYDDIASTSPFLKHIAFITNLIAIFLMLAAGIFGFLIIRNFAQGKVLEEENACLLGKSAKLLLAAALFSPLKEAIISYAFSAYKEEGNRIISISLGSEDIERWLLAGSIFIISWILKESVRLQQEDRLVI